MHNFAHFTGCSFSCSQHWVGIDLPYLHSSLIEALINEAILDVGLVENFHYVLFVWVFLDVDEFLGDSLWVDNIRILNFPILAEQDVSGDDQSINVKRRIFTENSQLVGSVKVF